MIDQSEAVVPCVLSDKYKYLIGWKKFQVKVGLDWFLDSQWELTSLLILHYQVRILIGKRGQLYQL